jgi:IclR family pca regulon transcriptional regulator
LRIIEAFNDTHPRLTPSTAAWRTGITRTAARRYLRTLNHLGYVESNGRLFWLTPRVLRLGWSYCDSAKVPRAVQPFLQQISAELDGASYFAVLDEDDVVCVARDGSYTPYTVTTQDGMRDLISNARRKGYALLEQQLERKVRGIGVPIRTRNAGIVGAIGISLAMEKETADHALSRALPLLQEAEYSLRTLL